MKFVDITGLIFNRLTVIKQSNKIKKEITWECLCSCGKTVFVTRNKLVNGRVKSCGCLNNEMRKLRTSKMTSARQKYSPQEASAKRIWNGRYNDGNINFEQFLNLSSQNCYYCDSPPINKYNESSSDKRRSVAAKENGTFIYNGLDRIDQSLPHHLDNVVPCCKICNMAKRDMNRDAFIKLINNIYLNLKRKT